MMRWVIPRAGARNVWLLTGRIDAAPSSGGQAPPLEKEEGWDDESVDDDEPGDGDASSHEGAAG